MPLLTIAVPSKGTIAPLAALRIVVDKPTDDALLGVTVSSNDNKNEVVVRFLTDDSILAAAPSSRVGLVCGRV